jgi:diguanylate cyclase (GGDEF)-like protein
MSLHRRLERQLRRLGLSPDAPPAPDEWKAFLERVSAAYAGQDQDRSLLQRSVGISSRETRALHESLRRREAEQAALRMIATEVARRSAPEAVFDLVSREVARLLRVEAARVLRFRPDGVADVVGVWGATGRLGRAGLPSTTMPPDPALASTAVLRTGSPAWAGDYAAATPYARTLAALSFRVGVAAPIRVDGVLWGALTAMTTREDGLPRGTEHRLEEFAYLVSLAIVNAESWHALAARATTDPLTGLANHREFHERLAAEARRARRHGRPLGLVFLDIDHFKPLNDTFGHEVGDRVLKAVAERLSALTRRGEVLGRIGGEEFAWILPETDVRGAVAAGERARRAIGDTPFPVVGRVTISAGAADLSQAASAPELARIADVALYWAKRKGRDVVVRYVPGKVGNLSAAERMRRLERDQRMSLVRLLARAGDACDGGSRRHSDVVADLACGIAERLGWEDDRQFALREAALVHDVGSLGVPEAILQKETPLTSEDLRLVRIHPILGAGIVAIVLTGEQASWVRHHHERWDGGGYPDGLAGEETPVGSRIIALADAWEAMTGARTYRPARSPSDALEECVRCSGTQFWPDAVEALLGLAADGALPDLEPPTGEDEMGAGNL